MKILITSSIIILLYINLSYGYINYLSYDSNCNQPINGVSFGLNEFYCMLNGTSSSTSLFTFEIFEENQVNLTSHRSSYCDYPVHSKLFTLNECSSYEYSNSNYFVSKTDNIPKIPSGSFIIKQYDSSCQNVNSYWYATNGTVIEDNRTGLKTTYLCINGTPTLNLCQSGSCKEIASPKSCDNNDNSSIECISNRNIIKAT